MNAQANGGGDLRELRGRLLREAARVSDAMNRTLGEFFARVGAEIVGVASEVMGPAQFQKIPIDDHMRLAYELGRSALTRFPQADGLYIGGGSWLSEPVCQALERDFSKRDHLSWQHLELIRRQWKGRLILKGVMTPDDARAMLGVRDRRAGARASGTGAC